MVTRAAGTGPPARRLEHRALDPATPERSANPRKRTLGAYAAALLSVLGNPDAVTCALVYLFFLYAIPSRLVVPTLGSAGAISMLVGLTSFIGWAVFQLSRTTSDASPWQTRPVRRGLIAFLMCVGISYTVAMARPISAAEVSPAMVAVLSVLSWSGALLLANDGVPSLARLHVLTTRVAQAGGLLALVGLVQFLTGDPVVNRISIPGLAAAPIELFTRDGFVRPFATATHPIEFGIIVAMLLPIALHSAFHGTHRSVLTRWFPVLALSMCLALTFSRSAYIAGGLALIVLVAGWPAKTRKVALVGMACLGGVLVVAVPRLLGVVNAMFRNVGSDPSISSRTSSYDLAWSFVSNAPIFGRGLGTFLPKYRIFDNEYLVLLVSVGAAGTVAFVALLLLGVYSSFRVYRRATDAVTKDLGLTLVASTLAGGVGLATFDGFAFPMTMGTLFLLLGVAGAAHRLVVTPRP